MLAKLPGWAVDDLRSVHVEAAPYVEMTPEMRGALMGAACRAAAKILRARADAARMLEYRDPLPESSRIALQRLRRTAKSRR